jgi:hypothetical protein
LQSGQRSSFFPENMALTAPHTSRIEAVPTSCIPSACIFQVNFWRRAKERCPSDQGLFQHVYEIQADEMRLEQQFIEAMQAQNITGAELARRTKSRPASISRDLTGGLSSAKLGRVRQMAAAVGYDVVTVLIPRDPNERRKPLEKVSRELRVGTEKS